VIRVGKVARERWDVVVTGAGPAGCAAAARILQSRRGASVLMLDRADFPRDKVCGDGIAARVFSALAEVGIDRAELTAGYSPTRTLRLSSPRGRTVERSMPDEGFVIPRLVFDGRLLQVVRSRGATFRQHTVHRIQVDADAVVIDGSIACDVLIGADGAESTVRRAAGFAPHRPGTVAVAIRGYAQELPHQHGAQIITMTRHSWPAYAWSFPVGAGLANVGYGEVSTAAGVTRATLLKRMHRLLPGLGPIEVRGHRLPLSIDRPPVRPGRVLLAGDALSLINPLSGEGIYYAVRSGMAAADAALSGQRAGDLYRKLLRQQLGRHLRHTTTLARLVKWWPLIDAGVEAARRDQGAFDDLAALALADGRITRRLVRGLRW